ncbi:hypothetical protein ACFQJC_04800 [Haloferax namakaokahaiae]|uniref:Uncharacterized protein n=1 Tax=Haloferax namakaokahaiae TaxID=1748331 RepID=A0ABD5ZD39_9EURY
MTPLETLRSLERFDKVRFDTLDESWLGPMFVARTFDEGDSVIVESGETTCRLDATDDGDVTLARLHESDADLLGRITKLEHIGRASHQKQLMMSVPEDAGLSPLGERREVRP